jgi:hypothetical protein
MTSATPLDVTANVQVINTTYQASPADVGKVYLLGATPTVQASWSLAAPNLAKDVFDLSGTNTSATVTFTNTGREFVYIANVSTAAITIDVNDQSACDHGFDHDPVSTIAHLATVMLGPFPVAWFTSTCSITVTGTAADGNPTISVFRLPAMSPMPE